MKQTRFHLSPLMLCLYSILLLLFFSCSGFRFKNTQNPFASYGIESVAVPMFQNKSVIPGVSGPMTKEFVLLLSRYSKLKVVPGEDTRADAILLGVIHSSPYVNKAMKATGFTTVPEETLGGRSSFMVPDGTEVKYYLNVILIKNPTSEELKLVKSDLAEKLIKGPKIIFNEKIELDGSFSRINNADNSPGGPAEVNLTRNRGLLSQTVETLSQNAAQSFKELFLYAF